MITFFSNTLSEAFGLNTPTVMPILYMTIRGVIIYFFGITLARFNKKLIGVRTPFNFILFVMLGSIFANAIAHADVFIPVLCTVCLLSVLNGTITALAFYFPSVEVFVKGPEALLVKDGEIQWNAMQKNFITKRELLNELNAQLHTESLDHIKKALLASDGTINFIEKK